MKITVTQADIDGAQPVSASDCPIARAVKRITGHPFAVTASQVAIMLHTIGGDSSIVTFLPSRAAVTFMNRFDDGQPVKPAVFICPEKPLSDVPA